MKLSIVIPALNEEQAIASIIERCLAARSTIVAESSVDEVEIIVVSDGSTDRTAEIAAGYADVRLIIFERNQGYGAALKRGFEDGAGELVGFLDADGTCDPSFFAVLCRAVIDENVSVALGSRIGPGSKMPPLRRLGNRLYAITLSALSNRVISDTASGMRVIRREVLPQLYPLPDGLHFTPAMSARILMDDSLTLVEKPMPYEERIGRSKLHIGRDGLRFLRMIFEMTLMWRPTRLFAGAAVLLAASTILLAMHPIEMWMRLGRLREDMIYRLLFCSFLGTLSATFLSTAAMSEHLHRLVQRRRKPTSFLTTLLDRLYSWRGLTVVAAPAAPWVAWLIGQGVWTWWTAGYVDVHWSRVVLAGLIAVMLIQAFATVLVVNVMRYHAERRIANETAMASIDPAVIKIKSSASLGSNDFRLFEPCEALAAVPPAKKDLPKP